MPTGKVKWFNNAKGYGFIIAGDNEPDLQGEDLFAHFSAIEMEGYKTLKAGQDVLFDVRPSGKGFHAVNIRSAIEEGSTFAGNLQPDAKGAECLVNELFEPGRLSTSASDSRVDTSSVAESIMDAEAAGTALKSRPLPEHA